MGEGIGCISQLNRAIGRALLLDSYRSGSMDHLNHRLVTMAIWVLWMSFLKDQDWMSGMAQWLCVGVNPGKTVRI